jgi:outer membrane lipoprotein-sorting protein
VREWHDGNGATQGLGKRPGRRFARPWPFVTILAVALVFSGCHVKTVTKVPASEIRPLLESTRDALMAHYNELSRSVRTVNAKVELAPHTGSRYSGVIEDYKQVNGFILAVSPNHIRMIGQAPAVSSKVFDMVCDGETFRIFIPPKGKFIVGPARFERASKKPLENLRPQHILEAIFWPPLDAGALVLFTEEQDGAARFYVLTVVSRGEIPEVTRRIWFDRSDLNLSRVEDYEPGGRLVSVARYSDWQAAGEGASYPREIALDRPRDDYRLDLRITTLALNAEIAGDRFQLEQPPGTELIRVGDKEQDAGGAPHP